VDAIVGVFYIRVNPRERIVASACDRRNFQGKLPLRTRERAIVFEARPKIGKGGNLMAMYVSLIQFTDQGIRNIKDTVKRGEAAKAEAEKMGVKIIEEYWTMGAYDVVVVIEAPDEAAVSAFLLKIGSLGNVKGNTLRAFRREEMESILSKIK